MKKLTAILALLLSAFAYVQAAVSATGDPVETASYESAADAAVATLEVTIPQAPATFVFAPLEGVFSTFLALAAFIPLAVQFLRGRLIPDAAGIWVQLFSWAVGMAITLAGWLLGLGFLDGLSLWTALLYGVGACLAANGVFDTGVVTALFGWLDRKSAPGK